MAALNELKTDSIINKELLHIIGSLLWQWIDANQDKNVFTAKIWIIQKTFKVRDLDPVFELLLGPRPVSDTVSPIKTG